MDHRILEEDIELSLFFPFLCCNFGSSDSTSCFQVKNAKNEMNLKAYELHQFYVPGAIGSAVLGNCKQKGNAEGLVIEQYNIDQYIYMHIYIDIRTYIHV